MSGLELNEKQQFVITHINDDNGLPRNVVLSCWCASGFPKSKGHTQIYIPFNHSGITQTCSIIPCYVKYLFTLISYAYYLYPHYKMFIFSFRAKAHTSCYVVKAIISLYR